MGRSPLQQGLFPATAFYGSARVGRNDLRWSLASRTLGTEPLNDPMAQPGILGTAPKYATELTNNGGSPCANGRIPGTVCTPQARILVSGCGAAGATQCVRGTVVTLTAAVVTPHFKSCQWRLAATIPILTKENLSFDADQGEDGAKGESLQAAETPCIGRSAVYSTTSVTLVALYSFKAELRLDDGSPATVEITVVPRTWKTEAILRRVERKIDGAPLLANGSDKKMGGNWCTLCGERAGEIIHFDKEKFFSLQKVEDAASLFGGLWYISHLELVIDRTIYVNADLLSGGAVYQLNQAKAEYKDALNRYVSSVREHETLHYDLIREKWVEARVNPTARIEAACSYDPDALKTYTTVNVELANSRLSAATAGKEGHGALRERLKRNLKGKNQTLSFLLPARLRDTQGVEFRVDLLDFED
jgi:hypothetical protein